MCRYPMGDGTTTDPSRPDSRTPVSEPWSLRETGLAGSPSFAPHVISRNAPEAGIHTPVEQLERSPWFPGHGGPEMRTRPRSIASPSIPALLILALAAIWVAGAPPAWSAPTVICSTGGDLQGEINAVPSGSTILIEGTCRGNFVITGKSLTLKGNPSGTIDGMETGHAIEVTTNNALRLAHLTITGGAAVDGGAGVRSIG